MNKFIFLFSFLLNYSFSFFFSYSFPLNLLHKYTWNKNIINSNSHNNNDNNNTTSNSNSNSNNSTLITSTITIIDGISLWKLTNKSCQLLTKEECIELTYTLSYYYYNNMYTPTRINSNREDYYSKKDDLISYLSSRYQFQNYLEIGCDQNKTYEKVEKLFLKSFCVDPVKGGNLRMVSNEFFQQNNENFDLILIDGLHEAPQVWNDIINSLKFLNSGGIILLHDMNPLLEKYQVVPEPEIVEIWNGDCWKVALPLRLMPDLDFIVGDFDHGVGIIMKRPNKNPLPVEWSNRLLEYMSIHTTPETYLNALTFEEFDQNREVLLPLRTIAEVRLWLEDLDI